MKETDVRNSLTKQKPYKISQERHEQEMDHLRQRLHELEGERNININHNLKEFELRKLYPALQDAWGQYQMLLRLLIK